MSLPDQQGIALSLHQKLGICKYCGHKLSFLEKRKRTKEGKVLCKKCGRVYADKNIVY